MQARWCPASTVIHINDKYIHQYCIVTTDIHVYANIITTDASLTECGFTTVGHIQKAVFILVLLIDLPQTCAAHTCTNSHSLKISNINIAGCMVYAALL